MIRLNCPVCGAKNSTLIDQREAVSILMHNVFDSAEAARRCKTGGLCVRHCDSCGFAWNAAFDPDRIVYGPGYDNAQGYSPQFQTHLDQRIDAIFAAFPGDRPVNIIEVGAGQGDFLKRMQGRAGHRIGRAVGFDPAWRGEDGQRIDDGKDFSNAKGSEIRMYRRIFDGEAASIAAEIDADLVLSRHVIEHVSEPMAFLRAIRAGIVGRPATRLFLETPDIDWIIRNGAFEDFFYEHCSIFNPASMATALRTAGYGDIVVKTVFGDQYLWAMARFEEEGAALDEPEMPARGASFSTQSLVLEWQRRIDRWHEAGGKVALWGAGAKGMTFAQIVDPAGERIAVIVDMNPGKQGKFIGVTGHAVVTPEALHTIAPTHIIIMNPVYAPEIRAMLAANAIHASLLTLHEDLT